MALTADSSLLGIAVELRGVSHTYKTHPVFIPVSVQLPSGSECLIRGTNGSGKSTLGRIIAGELTAAIGSVHWSREEESLDADALCTRSQRISPVSTLHPQLTIAELVEFQSQFQTKAAESAAYDLLHKAGLAKQMEKAFRELSSGMQQRVKLAMALASQAELIVLDEPCVNLDASGIAWYREALEEIKGRATLVICSNNRSEDFIDPNFILDLIV
tara:strand:+ start:2321 stop:2968 length:648 start_codon:yes stop_codon:yes gene_type:complete